MDKYKHYPYSSTYRNISSNQYGVIKPWELFKVSKSSKNLIQRLKRWNVLEGHSGCVNTVAWNTSGYLLLTGSDDYLLNIYDVFKNKLLHSITSGHRANIFSAKFLPCTSDMKIVSCSGDGMLHYNELGTDYGQNYFNCHSGTAYEILVTPGDPNGYLSCGEDGTVRMFDLRTKTKCHCQECSEDILIDCRHAVTSISVNPLLPYHLAAGCKDSYVRVFDRRMLGTSTETRSVNRNKGWMPGLFCKFKPEKLKKDMSCRVTSLQYSHDGKDLLVSYCTDYVYLFTVKDKEGKVMDLNKNKNDLSHNGTVNGHTSDHSDELPPVKRLRLRGDWSDTGPQARPENDDENSPENNLMQRMSELFSRWLEDAMYAGERQPSTSSDSSQDISQVESRGSSEGEQTEENTIQYNETQVENEESVFLNTGNTRESSDTFNMYDPVAYAADEQMDSTDENWFLNDVDEISNNDNDIMLSQEENTLTQVDNDHNIFYNNASPYIPIGNTTTKDNSIEIDTTKDFPVATNNEFETASNIDQNQALPSVLTNEEIMSDTTDQISIVDGNAAHLSYDSNEENERTPLLEDLRNNLHTGIGNIQSERENAHTHFIDSYETARDVHALEMPFRHNETYQNSANNNMVSTASSMSSRSPSSDTTQMSTSPNSVFRFSSSELLHRTEENSANLIDNSETVQSLSENEMPSDSRSSFQNSATGISRGSTYEASDVPVKSTDGTENESPQQSRLRYQLNRDIAASRIQKFLRSFQNGCSQHDCHIGKPDCVYLPSSAMVFKGHRNSKTMIKEANFWGNDYVLSGSDCGRIFIWDRHTGELVMLLQGDQHVVNCVQPHPYDPILATSGIDHDVKIWAPLAEETANLTNLAQIVKRNEQMLEESRDTITVPASFVLRMLASFGNIRNRRTARRRFGSEDTDNTEEDS